MGRRGHSPNEVLGTRLVSDREPTVATFAPPLSPPTAMSSLLHIAREELLEHVLRPLKKEGAWKVSAAPRARGSP